MKEQQLNFDVVIIGSGLGGLVCGAILSQEGKRVCILEKNEQVGGSLQTFRRDGVTFDTGVHYIGGLEPGENLFQIFNYLGIMERLQTRRMDENGFDAILFKNDDEVYPYGMGYENFIRILSEKFPDEEAAIRKYCNDLKRICDNFPLYNLKPTGEYQDQTVFTTGVKDYIENLTSNKKLQNVLVGSIMVYAGLPDKTPLYVHALVINSYIESSNKCIDGGDQIAKLLTRSIKENGGTVLRKTAVNEIHVENGLADYAVVEGGKKVWGKTFISNIHPVKTMEITSTNIIRTAYRTRINSLQNSISAFVLYIVLKPNSYKYTNRNYYYFDEVDVWRSYDYTDETWPYNYGLFEGLPDKNSEYATTITVIAYMHFDDVKKWDNTHNTTLDESNRGEDYEAFKEAKAERLLETVYIKFPHLRYCIKSYYTSTPLSYRDYIGSNDGGMYGIMKDYNDPIKTMIAPKTKIPNLLLTGQNINLHGVLGVTVSAVITCTMLLGREYLINKILEANEASV
jgi:all-trans-retinol 13,14-reductase